MISDSANMDLAIGSGASRRKMVAMNAEAAGNRREKSVLLTDGQRHESVFTLNDECNPPE